ncbi:MAG: hypothetical protein QOH26_1617 [Actinomycetota bacterium]|jgi:hypothetical protein|nr:hypothetical protein [Actinomycetota bacterium]
MKDEPSRLRDLLGPLGQRLGMRDPARTGLVWARWVEIVGPGIAAHCRPSSLRDGVLRLRTDSPTWATEVGYLAEEISRKVNEIAREPLVTEVRVWVKPFDPEPDGGSRDRATKETPATSREPSSGDPLEALARARAAWARRSQRERS